MVKYKQQCGNNPQVITNNTVPFVAPNNTALAIPKCNNPTCKLLCNKNFKCVCGWNN